MTTGREQSVPDPREAHAPYEQPEWLRLTLASIGDAVITTDNKGHVTFLNAMAQSLTGWTKEEAVGQPLDAVFVVVNEESRRAVENPATRALKEGIIVGLANHSLIIARDGTERSIDDSAAPIRNVQGQVAGVVLIFRDITERRRIEREVDAALSYAQDIIRTLREPFLVLDRELRVQSANPSFYRNFHTSEEETERRFLYELGNGQWDIPRLRELLEEVLPQNHTIEEFEVEHDFPAIGRRSMLLNARRVLRDSEPGHLILLAIEDVTERKQVEATLIASEVSYRRLFETARDGILILNSEGQIVDANPFITEILGYTREELLGKELWQIGVFGDIQASRDSSEQLQREGYVRYEHLPLRTKDGRAAEVEFISNVYQIDGRRVFQCNIRDITERRRMERQILQQTEELQDADRRKDEFLAMLSHELRNPLTPIASAAYLLGRQESQTPIQQEAAAIIARQVAHLTRLVDDLLEVSRIATGKLGLRKEPIELIGTVAGAVEALRSLLDERRHEFNASLPAEPIWLEGDASRLVQVVSNLITNSAKYTEGSGKISLTVQRDGDEAVLRVRDSGLGIDAQLLPRVFDLFTQADESLARPQAGLGVGLALVKTIVELHGGTVEAHSDGIGQGSEFIVRLPTVPPPAGRSAPASGEPKASTGRALRVLVVDDNEDVTRLFQVILQTAGHVVRRAHTGRQALEIAPAFRPDVVLLDIGLPGPDGCQIAGMMRQDPLLQNVVLLAVTGYGREEDRLRSRDAGFDHHLVKPVDPDDLEQLLADISNSRAT